MSLPDRFLAIDEEGYPLLGELRVQDAEVGAEILKNIRFAENNAFETSMAEDRALVEAFDEPYVAAQVFRSQNQWQIQLPYDVRFSFDLKSLSLDEWDRFHGIASNGIPFVLSRKAQAEFFNLVDEYDDDSITVDHEQIEIPSWFPEKTEVRQEKFWTNIYQTEEPKWELNKPAPAFEDILPRIKLQRSRILVLGCGSGNDAAFFARHGHTVTAVDISAEALDRAKEKYKDLSNITWIQSDIFKLGRDHEASYDLIVEHTCYCAIDPSQRNALVMLWKRLLAEGGQLLGVFFAMERRDAPPFGGTEWELRERLKKHFQFIFWGRWHQSIDRRNGKELLVFATKR